MFSCWTLIKHVRKHLFLKTLQLFSLHNQRETQKFCFKNRGFCINGFVSFKSEVKKVGKDFHNDTFMATNNLFHEPKNKLGNRE